MQNIRLGRTDEQVSAIACGTWSHGGPKTVGKRAVGWSGHDDAMARGALIKAFEVGINHWDTADVYGDGQAERLIGSVFGEVPRDSLFIASKVGWDPGGHKHFYHPEMIERHCERSLASLDTDRIDLYYFHHCDFGPDDRYLDDALAVFHRLKEQGKIRFIGLSDWSSEKLLRLSARVDPDVVQPYRNVVDDAWISSGLSAWTAEHDVGAAFFSPLRHGVLLGKYDAPPQFEPGDFRSEIPEFQSAEAIARFRDCRLAVEQRMPGNPQPVLEALTGALLTDAPQSSVLLGMRTPDHAAAAGRLGSPLEADLAAWIRSIYRAT